MAPAIFAADFNVALASLTNHNTSAYVAYNETNFPANFGTTSWINQNGTTMAVDPTQMDESLNPITPGHVSHVDVHTLIPSRPDLRWFAHATPWFGTGSHINIGLVNNSDSYVAAMITDMESRGFNGVVIDWYGQGDGTDGVTQKIKSYLASQPGNTFTYIVMVDKGVRGGANLTNLQAQINYCKAQYFSDPNYEREPLTNGLPILMFFGVRAALGETSMAILKGRLGGQMVWVEQGTSYIGESWEDECFEWTDQFNNGVNASDPFNLAAVVSDYPTIQASGKKFFGAMCARFNGTLTKSVGWSMGKYLPGSNGLCLVERAAAINAAVPGSMTRMQWPTWSDWEEGTQVESGIENSFALAGRTSGSNTLAWSILSGDERTIDHYEIYASTNGVTAAFVGSVAAGIHATNVSQAGLPAGQYQFYVDALGKPCVRDHMSQATPMTLAGPAGFGTAGNISVNYNSAAAPGPLTLSWSSGRLQSAPSVGGPYSDVPGATNPCVIEPSNAQQFFRIVSTP